MNFVLESYCIIRTLVDFVFPPCLLLLVLLQVFLSLSFDEDLGRAARNDEKHKPQSKKSKKKKHYEEARQLKENDKKRSRQELLTKTREEVFFCFAKSIDFLILLVSVVFPLNLLNFVMLYTGCC